MIEFLFDTGVDPNIYIDGTRPLLDAMYSDIRNTELIRLLISYEASPYLENRYNQTAYDILNKERNYLSVDKYKEILDILDSSVHIKEPDIDYY